MAPIPPSSRVSQLSKPVDPWNTSELDHWSRGANFLSSFGTCCCFECSGPSTWPKKAERSGEKLGDACLWFENGHPKLFNFQQMVENAWKSTSWRLIDHSCGYCPWYLSKANKNRPVAPLNGVDSGARLCRNPILLSSLSLVELSFWCWFNGFIYIYIIWFNGHNLAYPPILRYTWGCIPTIVITWLIIDKL